MRYVIIFLFTSLLSSPLFAAVINLHQDDLYLYSTATLEPVPGESAFFSESYSGYILNNNVSVSAISAGLIVETIEDDEVQSVYSYASGESTSNSFTLMADTEVYPSGQALEGSIYDVTSVTALATLDWLFTVSEGDVLFHIAMLETSLGYLSLVDLTLGSQVLEINSFGLISEEFMLQNDHQYAMYVEAFDDTFDDADLEIYGYFEDAEIVNVPEPAGLALFAIGMIGIVALRLFKRPSPS